jgi:hypothetical protein
MVRRPQPPAHAVDGAALWPAALRTARARRATALAAAAVACVVVALAYMRSGGGADGSTALTALWEPDAFALAASESLEKLSGAPLPCKLSLFVALMPCKKVRGGGGGARPRGAARRRAGESSAQRSGQCRAAPRTPVRRAEPSQLAGSRASVRGSVLARAHMPCQPACLHARLPGSRERGP